MKLFERVHCKAYMAKHSDGIHMEVYNEDGTPCMRGLDYTKKVYARNMDDEDIIADLSEFCGQTVHKVYRKRKEEEFDGFLVGVTQIKCEGEIGTDMDYGWDGRGFYHFIKTTTYNPKVGVVYFKNNCKRYVLLEDMEIIE